MVTKGKERKFDAVCQTAKPIGCQSPAHNYKRMVTRPGNKHSQSAAHFPPTLRPLTTHSAVGESGNVRAVSSIFLLVTFPFQTASILAFAILFTVICCGSLGKRHPLLHWLPTKSICIHHFLAARFLLLAKSSNWLQERQAFSFILAIKWKSESILNKI